MTNGAEIWVHPTASLSMKLHTQHRRNEKIIRVKIDNLLNVLYYISVVSGRRLLTTRTKKKKQKIRQAAYDKIT